MAQTMFLSFKLDAEHRIIMIEGSIWVYVKDSCEVMTACIVLLDGKKKISSPRRMLTTVTGRDEPSIRLSPNRWDQF